ncbi:hypothetical protein DFH07DRAFT_785162 [Mycena maculata]|uniref:WD40 repeat-like protein n=1 Tax=Mycena maculata TaxID=230809 RepID=A0AAD7MHQ3_9AGAR|nr:hypothetical protein DFH07DRAFT_785162 [Mycena maculata]
MSHSKGSKIRYYPEHYLLAPIDISQVCLSPSAGLLALSRGFRISVHPVPKCLATTQGGSHPDINEELLSVYTQDGPCDVTALVWLTEKTFVAGYVDGTVVFTSVTVGQESVIHQPHRLIVLTGPGLGSRSGPVCWCPNSNARVLAVLTDSDIQLWEISSSLIPTCKSRTGGLINPRYLTWSSRALKSIYVVGAHDMVEWDTRRSSLDRSSLAAVAHLEPNHELKCVSWDGRYRLHGVQRPDNCHLTCTDTMTGKETFVRFPTPHLIDRDFLAAFVHGDRLVAIASSHKIVLWDPSKTQLILQEFHHPTRNAGYDSPNLTAISAASRAQFSRIVHTFVTVRGAEAIVWQATSPRPFTVFFIIVPCALVSLLVVHTLLQLANM